MHAARRTKLQDRLCASGSTSPRTCQLHVAEQRFLVSHPQAPKTEDIPKERCTLRLGYNYERGSLDGDQPDRLNRSNCTVILEVC